MHHFNHLLVIQYLETQLRPLLQKPSPMFRAAQLQTSATHNGDFLQQGPMLANELHLVSTHLPAQLRSQLETLEVV